MRWVFGMQVLAIVLCIAFLIASKPFSDAYVSDVSTVVANIDTATAQERAQMLPDVGRLALNRAEATRAARRNAGAFAAGMTLLLISSTALLWDARRVVYSRGGIEISQV